MASLSKACRLSARIVAGQVRHNAASRDLRTSAASLAAHNFTMPALSPTMTGGNIASWKVKEGDSFSAGDVLLEIETDKATMDVEAQDDGILAKIMQGDGSKAVKVGSRIAVFAEPGDDLDSLQIPEEAPTQSKEPKEDTSFSTPKEATRQDRPSPQDELSGGLDPTERSPSAAEFPPSSKANADAEAGGAADSRSSAESAPQKSGAAGGGKAQIQHYPLYPSVQHLLLSNGLSQADADKIPATGPKSRLLKGDVLAYLGKIEKSYASDLSKRLEKLGHLDLSNIKKSVAKREAPPVKPAAAAPATVPAPDTEVAVSVSLSAAIATQKRIQDTLGIFLPISTFIARASELANEDLPRSKSRKVTADELFNFVLGLDKVSGPGVSQGHFMPQVTALSPVSLAKPPVSKRLDVIDVLAGIKPRSRPTPKNPASTVTGAAGVIEPLNVFSLTVKQEDERRARVFLDRVKRVLEAEPGRLVL